MVGRRSLQCDEARDAGRPAPRGRCLLWPAIAIVGGGARGPAASPRACGALRRAAAQPRDARLALRAAGAQRLPGPGTRGHMPTELPGPPASLNPGLLHCLRPFAGRGPCRRVPAPAGSSHRGDLGGRPAWPRAAHRHALGRRQGDRGARAHLLGRALWRAAGALPGTTAQGSLARRAGLGRLLRGEPALVPQPATPGQEHQHQRGLPFLAHVRAPRGGAKPPAASHRLPPWRRLHEFRQLPGRLVRRRTFRPAQ
mmetsp:Transcript_29868/g.95219  ORF Transcript_29868/g.95219 Transcript_29868/m.95219 type:complete len:255 (-) Transcript_29868:1640-2404(-)